MNIAYLVSDIYLNIGKYLHIKQRMTLQLLLPKVRWIDETYQYILDLVKVSKEIKFNKEERFINRTSFFPKSFLNNNLWLLFIKYKIETRYLSDALDFFVKDDVKTEVIFKDNKYLLVHPLFTQRSLLAFFSFSNHNKFSEDQFLILWSKLTINEKILSYLSYCWEGGTRKVGNFNSVVYSTLGIRDVGQDVYDGSIEFWKNIFPNHLHNQLEEAFNKFVTREDDYPIEKDDPNSPDSLCVSEIVINTCVILADQLHGW